MGCTSATTIEKSKKENNVIPHKTKECSKDILEESFKKSDEIIANEVNEKAILKDIKNYESPKKIVKENIESIIGKDSSPNFNNKLIGIGNIGRESLSINESIIPKVHQQIIDENMFTLSKNDSPNISIEMNPKSIAMHYDFKEIISEGNSENKLYR